MGLNGISASESVWGDTQSGAASSLLSQLAQDSRSISFQDGMLANLFSELDSDGDGAISRSEMQERVDNVQDLLSSLNDMGAQMTACKAKEGPDFGRMVEDIISEMDADGSGTLSEAEASLSSGQFASIDVNGDGTLDSGELASSLKSDFASHMPPPPQGDGKDSSSSSSIEGDTDGDGELSQAELAVLIMKNKGQMSDMLKNASQGDSGGSQLLQGLSSASSWMYNFDSIAGQAA